MLRESREHRHFAGVADFLERIPIDCPHELFQGSERASQTPLGKVKTARLVVVEKEKTRHSGVGCPAFSETRPVLDDPTKTARLIDELKAAVPFAVALTPEVVSHLRAKRVATTVEVAQTVADLSYAGDEGGIVCHLAGSDGGAALFVSLTHIRVPRSQPFAVAVLQYQKHRVKKLKKQGYA